MNNNKQQWWEKFWSERSPSIGTNDREAESWTDLVWQVGLEELNTSLLRLTAGKKMLECGCGQATVSRYLAKRGYDCTMLDYSSQALALAKTSFALNSLKGEFVLGDMNHLPFNADQFDIVYTGGVLEFFNDINAPLREIVRVLKPGGVLAINIVPNKFSCQTLGDIERTLVHALKNLLLLRWREIFIRLNHLPPGVSRTSLKEYVSALELAGLKNVTGYSVTPFPALSLGRRGERAYVRLLNRLLPYWRKFNHSHYVWSERWGMAYTIYGAKPETMPVNKKSGD